MTRPDLTVRAAEDAQALLVRAERMRRRAARARAGSNERAECIKRSVFLRACATQLVIDKDLQADIAGRLPRGSGWRALADAVSASASKRAKS